MCSTYNGWSNYATWRVNLEICDDIFSSMDEDELIALKRDTITEYGEYYGNAAADLKDRVLEILDLDGSSGLVRDYAEAFLDDVNFSEIVRTQLSDVEIPAMDDEEAPDNE